jgi:hypothetical protein
MIVIGTDTHKASHTAAAADAATGQVLAERTVRAKRRSFDDLLRWARRLRGERVWAIEDCRHVSGALERFLLARGERVLRVAPKLTAGARDSAREPGKSDVIDAVAIARAAIREGLDTLPSAQLAGIELDIRLLVDHRGRLVATRTRLINDLRWHLHDLWPELEIPTGGLIAVRFRSGSPPGSHTPLKQQGSGSRATSCAASANSRAGSTRSNATSHRSSRRQPPDCSPSAAAAY